MQDRFANRLGMFDTVLGVLKSPEHKPTWENQPPTIFTTKVATAQQAVDDLKSFIASHSQEVTGTTADKRREEKELEDAAFELSQTLLEWFNDQNDLTNAAKVDRPISGWRRMRDQELVAQATIVRDVAQGVIDGAQATDASAYGIDAAAVQSLSTELEEYSAVLTAPRQSITSRAALTAQFRPRFNAVEANFESLDRLIHRFGTTPAGTALIAAYQASRTIVDLGHGPPPQPPVLPPEPV